MFKLIQENNCTEMNTLQIKIKKLHPDAVTPSYAKAGDAGLDLTAAWEKSAGETLKPYTEYGTGLSFEIPEGYVGLLFPRSSISKTTFSLANSVGVLDSGFRGEVTFRFSVTGSAGLLLHHRMKGNLSKDQWDQVYEGNETYKAGDKIGQLVIMPYPRIELIEAEELSTTERGANGYGSSGR